MFLAPVLDLVTGHNPWLQGRGLGADAAEVARIGAAFVRGVEAAGVVATAKHFPGHHDMDGDPAICVATVSGGAVELLPGMIPFRAAIKAGARAVMTGPALVPGLDVGMPSSLSAPTIARLRDDLGFAGLVVSDDLDAAGTLRAQRDVPGAAVAVLRAGSDLLLLSAANDLAQVSARILAAVAGGSLPESRLAKAAARVRALADSTG
ncbi:glycoside hydrolase family 3 N-terminal domain-containing protein [Paracoccus sp. (in: a-proteobacteria)]|uniref:glycoside hydrolase family 3 N-terminal domain-containing protein n=1 Tax=Paracoccus sp. TaxID=267 RepID=UPI00321FC8E8